MLSNLYYQEKGMQANWTHKGGDDNTEYAQVSQIPFNWIKLC